MALTERIGLSALAVRGGWRVLDCGRRENVLEDQVGLGQCDVRIATEVDDDELAQGLRPGGCNVDEEVDRTGHEEDVEDLGLRRHRCRELMDATASVRRQPYRDHRL